MVTAQKMAVFSVGITAIALAAAVPMASASIIYSDPLTGSPTANLAGSVTGGVTWQAYYSSASASNGFFQDGSVNVPDGTSNTYNQVVDYLPTTLSNNTIYTLSATLTPTGGSGWLAVGFFNNGIFVGGTGPWMNLNSTGSVNVYYNGVSKGSTNAATGGTATIVLNTSSTGWKFEGFYNNVLLTGGYISIPNTDTFRTSSPSGVGLASYKGVGTAGSFLLATPEPATLGMLGVGGLGLLLAKRRKSA